MFSFLERKKLFKVDIQRTYPLTFNVSATEMSIWRDSILKSLFIRNLYWFLRFRCLYQWFSQFHQPFNYLEKPKSNKKWVKPLKKKISLKWNNISECNSVGIHTCILYYNISFYILFCLRHNLVSRKKQQFSYHQ